MKKFTLVLILLLTAPFLANAACAADSPKDVQAAIARGDYPGAEKMLRDAVAGHPQSAKAHYVLAEVLAHEGNVGEAKAEASKAATLDPATRFTDPAKFQAFQRHLDAALAPSSANRLGNDRAAEGQSLQPQRAQGGLPLLPVLIVVGIVVVAIIMFMSRRRRQQSGPFGNAPYGTPPNPPSPYGDNFGNNGGYGAPGYPPQQRGPGVGTAVAAGLGGLAAGALLDEAFRSHREGEVPPPVNPVDRDTGADASGQAYDDLRNDPIDMGNNDSSWDDSSSGDDSSFDDNQW